MLFSTPVDNIKLTEAQAQAMIDALNASIQKLAEHKAGKTQ